MAILKVAKLGHPVLRNVAEPYTKPEILLPQTQKFIEDMIETMHDYEGIGLAAPQVHVSKQLFVVEVPETRTPKLKPFPLTIMFNPKFTFKGEEKIKMWEGCLSVPGFRGLVYRHKHLTLTYLDQKGKEKKLEAYGFLAGVLQHESDHLLGKVYLDRMESLTDLAFIEEWNRYMAETADFEEGYVKFL